MLNQLRAAIDYLRGQVNNGKCLLAGCRNAGSAVQAFSRLRACGLAVGAWVLGPASLLDARCDLTTLRVATLPRSSVGRCCLPLYQSTCLADCSSCSLRPSHLQLLHPWVSIFYIESIVRLNGLTGGLRLGALRPQPDSDQSDTSTCPSLLFLQMTLVHPS